jgi:hypothetical protein
LPPEEVTTLLEELREGGATIHPLAPGFASGRATREQVLAFARNPKVQQIEMARTLRPHFRPE